MLNEKYKTNKPRKDRQVWYKLDLSANVYPTLQRKNFSSVFRLSCLLKEEVRPDILQEALDRTIHRFPSFHVAIRKGLFWRYLEPNRNPGPFVMPDIINPCMPMPFKSKHQHLIRIYYYDRRIALEIFHSVADGGGGMFFLKTLIAVYLRLLGHEIPDTFGVLDINEPPHREELEDAYLRYASSKIRLPRSQQKAYQVSGTKEQFHTLNIICGVIPTDKILAAAKRYKVSLTEYLNAVLIYSLLEKQKSNGNFRLKPVTLAIPVSLRKYFPSMTLRNFIAMIYPTVDPRYGDYTFEEIVDQVHFYMRYHLNAKYMNASISTNMSATRNLFVRIVPLFIKDFILKRYYMRIGDKQASAGLTNLGPQSIPEEMKEHIERFDVLMGQPFSAKTNCAVISFGNVLTVNFASSIVETDVEMVFFRKLISDGIPVKIESNRNMEVL